MTKWPLRIIVIVAVLWTNLTGPALAELTPAAAIPIVLNYVTSLQVGNIQALQQLAEPFLFQQVMLQTTGNGVYPVVSRLGPITGIQLGPTVNSFNFTAQIQHQYGKAEWQFLLSSTRPVIIAAILLKVVFPNPNTTALSFPTLLPAPPSPPGPVIKNGTLDMPCDRLPAACGAQQRIFSNDPRLVEFLFATDRIPQNGAQAVSFTGDRQSSLTFGAVSVHVPETHKIGRTELPSVWKVFGIELRHEPLDEAKHFVVRQLQIMTPHAWGDLIRETHAKSALIFVHGFNTSFEDAVFRNAQIVYDLDY
jgi:hypothetical protein